MRWARFNKPGSFAGTNLIVASLSREIVIQLLPFYIVAVIPLQSVSVACRTLLRFGECPISLSSAVLVLIEIHRINSEITVLNQANL